MPSLEAEISIKTCKNLNQHTLKLFLNPLNDHITLKRLESKSFI